MGLAIGAGFYECMLVGVVLILLCMALFSGMEAAFLANARSMNMYVEMEGLDTIGPITARIKSEGCKIYDLELCDQSEQNSRPLAAVVSIGLLKRQNHMDILAMLSGVEGVVRVEET
jgi:putative Mg2+ transporter-C (MgtC) family protein